MSKNHDRYKEDYTHVDDEVLDELDTEKFEKFHPKKESSKKKSSPRQKAQSKFEED